MTDEMRFAAALTEAVRGRQPVRITGAVERVNENSVSVRGLGAFAAVGDLVEIEGRDGRQTAAEIVAFDGRVAIALPFGPLSQVVPDAPAALMRGSSLVFPDPSWLGAVFDGYGRPLQATQAVRDGGAPYDLRRAPPSAIDRASITEPIDVGVRSINTFLTCGVGQRVGIFAGSGVGKTTLLGMLASHAAFDAIVIALIGERGKELQDFLGKYVGAESFRRTAIVISTSDQPAVLRRRAALLAVSVAEYLRDQGKRVLFLMDSVTRYAGALREIGLAAGEPVAANGFPPSVFAQLPQLVERLGTAAGGKSITAFLTVLVEGDDMDDPLGDAVRGFLDGHIVLNRATADRGRFPAIDVMRSVSRAAPDVRTPEQAETVRQAIVLEALYREVEDLYRVGLYKKGTDPETDRAIEFHIQLERLLDQKAGVSSKLDQDFEQLTSILLKIAST
jgi:flagellum-specific ATP synthase